MRARLALLTLTFAALASPQIAAVPSAESQHLEYEVKAAFLLNFTKFIEWPPSATSTPPAPFNICVMGDDPFGPVLDQTVQGETVNRRPLVIQRLGHSAPKSCQIVYIPHTGPALKDLLATLGPGVLTVGEEDTFLRDGGMIAFVLENRRVRFSVNLAPARSAMLTLSSRLLSVAKAVGSKW